MFYHVWLDRQGCISRRFFFDKFSLWSVLTRTIDTAGTFNLLTVNLCNPNMPEAGLVPMALLSLLCIVCVKAKSQCLSGLWVPLHTRNHYNHYCKCRGSGQRDEKVPFHTVEKSFFSQHGHPWKVAWLPLQSHLKAALEVPSHMSVWCYTVSSEVLYLKITWP